jgi:predicted glycoside hydrolase/deacetylase ChbG (UPF0249 family)
MNLGQRLGYPADQRLLIVHADDIGLSRAVNRGAFECLEGGSVTCGSVLVPCPQFPEVAEYCAAHPEADIGVHLTLTSGQPPYRWPPLTAREAGPGLYDSEGYMWPTYEEAMEHVTPEEAEREFRAQIEKALAAGIDVTHLDSHSGTALHPKFIGQYVSLGREYGLPIMLPRPDPDLLRSHGLSQFRTLFEDFLRPVDEAGYPLIDHLVDTSGLSPEVKDDYFRTLLDGLKAGVTHFLIHPAMPSEDVEAATDEAAYRVRDYEIFRDDRMRRHLEGMGVRLIGYRLIREALRSGSLAPP